MIFIILLQGQNWVYSSFLKVKNGGDVETDGGSIARENIMEIKLVSKEALFNCIKSLSANP